MKIDKEYTWLNFARNITNIICVIIVISISYMVGVKYTEHSMQPQIDTLTSKLNDATWNIYSKTKLNSKNIDYWLLYFSVQHKDIVKAQILLETHNLQSDMCNNENNLFGMKFAKQRLTTATHSNNKYACYSSYISSIEDYSIWQQTYYNGTMDYYKFLIKSGYATDSSYIVKLKKIK